MTAKARERESSPRGITRLRVVVFTAGELLPINRVFFARLAKDPLIDLAAIIVDEHQRPLKPLLARVFRGLREDGWRWLRFKLASKLRSLARTAGLRLAARVHGNARSEGSYEELEASTGIPIHRVADIHQPRSLDLIRSLSPDLGVIVGGRILRESVIAIPAHGTLNIHKRKVPEYRGGGPIGYWELLAGEPSIGVTIHYATAAVDAGPVLAQEMIPIETCDTLDSLQLKADLRGALLYHETLRRFAQGERQGEPQDASQGTTYRAPGEYKVWQLQRRLAQNAAATMPVLRGRQSWLVKLRLLVEFIAVLPRLKAIKRRLISEHRAPITIFFYHLVADRPLNHMALPLTEFARQVEFLRRHYAVVSLDEAVERLRSGNNDRIAASITFDDGYRDNKWAIEYLRYYGIPAAFFISIGHIRDGSSFEHDLRRGYKDARPMSEEQLRDLAGSGFIIGSHGVHHENFGSLDSDDAHRVLRESRELIDETCSCAPAYFAFPKGQRGTNITQQSFALGLKHYPYIFSAYGGRSFPQVGRRHFVRTCNPTDLLSLGMLMSGYTGFRQCLTGNAWGLETDALDPCSSVARRRATHGEAELTAANRDRVVTNSMRHSSTNRRASARPLRSARPQRSEVSRETDRL